MWSSLKKKRLTDLPLVKFIHQLHSYLRERRNRVMKKLSLDQEKVAVAGKVPMQAWYE
jgi:hypothetical protein